MIYNNKEKREILIEQFQKDGVYLFENGQPKFAAYINLCIHPHTWESTYAKLRTGQQISTTTWECLVGVLYAFQIHLNKSVSGNSTILPDIAIDFIDFIRKDKSPDPWKFLHSMRRYYPRYCIIKSLRTFGIDWRELAYEKMGSTCKPTPKSYHSVFTNIYVRSLVKAVVVYKQYRTPEDLDYVAGVNDIQSLLKATAASPKCIDELHLEQTVNELLRVLPNWNTSIRGKVSYMLCYLQPASALEKQMLPSLQRKVLGQ